MTQAFGSLLICILLTGVLAQASAEESTVNPQFATLAAELEQRQGELTGIDKLLPFVQDWFRSRKVDVELVPKSLQNSSRGVIIVGLREEIGRLNLPSFPEQAVIWWEPNGNLKLDQFRFASAKEKGSSSPVPLPVSMPQQVVLGKQGEMGLVYDGGYGGNTVRPYFILYHFEDGRCKEIWRSPDCDPWRDQDASISFPNGTPDRIIIEGTGWGSTCVLDNIINEPHAGPHRVLSYTWERRGDTYVVTAWDQPRDTPYNALVNFMYGLITGNEESTLRFAESPAVLAQAQACSFSPTVDSVGGVHAVEGWVVERSDPKDCWYKPDPSRPCAITVQQTNILNMARSRLYGGPEGRTQKWRVTLVSINGHWKVRSITKE